MSITGNFSKAISNLSKSADSIKTTLFQQGLLPETETLFVLVGDIVENIIDAQLPQHPEASKISIFNEIMELLINWRPKKNEKDIAIAHLLFLAGLEFCISKNFIKMSHNLLYFFIERLQLDIVTSSASLMKTVNDINNLPEVVPAQFKMNLDSYLGVMAELNKASIISFNGVSSDNDIHMILKGTDAAVASMYPTLASPDSYNIDDLLTDVSNSATSLNRSIEYLNGVLVLSQNMDASLESGDPLSFVIQYLTALQQEIMLSKINYADKVLARTMTNVTIISKLIQHLTSEARSRVDEYMLSSAIGPLFKYPKILAGVFHSALLEYLSSAPSDGVRTASLMVASLEIILQAMTGWPVYASAINTPIWASVFQKHVPTSGMDNFRKNAIAGNWRAMHTLNATNVDSQTDAFITLRDFEMPAYQRSAVETPLNSMTKYEAQLGTINNSNLNLAAGAYAQASQIHSFLKDEFNNISASKLKAPLAGLSDSLWTIVGQDLDNMVRAGGDFDTKIYDNNVAATVANESTDKIRSGIISYERKSEIGEDLESILTDLDDIQTLKWERPILAGQVTTAVARSYFVELVRFIKTIKDRYRVI